MSSPMPAALHRGWRDAGAVLLLVAGNSPALAESSMCLSSTSKPLQVQQNDRHPHPNTGKQQNTQSAARQTISNSPNSTAHNNHHTRCNNSSSSSTSNSNSFHEVREMLTVHHCMIGSFLQQSVAAGPAGQGPCCCSSASPGRCTPWQLTPCTVERGRQHLMQCKHALPCAAMLSTTKPPPGAAADLELPVLQSRSHL